MKIPDYFDDDIWDCKRSLESAEDFLDSDNKKAFLKIILAMTHLVRAVEDLSNVVREIELKDD